MPKSIVLYGPMARGKTRHGHVIAKRLGLNHVMDLDDVQLQGERLQRSGFLYLCAPDGPVPTPATVERWAEAQGILYKYDRRGRIWTTTDAVNAALGLQVVPAAPPEQELLRLV